MRRVVKRRSPTCSGSPVRPYMSGNMIRRINTWQRQVPGHCVKRPYRFLLKSEQPFAFAGIWKEQKGEEGSQPHCAIITTEPNRIVSMVHDRMPAILKPEAEAEWISLDT